MNYNKIPFFLTATKFDLHKKDILTISIFGILIIISVQPSVLEFTEQDLGNHMILEHTLFFLIGALSIQLAETILRLLVHSYNRKYLYYHRKYQMQLEDTDNKTNTVLVIISFWAKLLRKVFTINRYGFIWLIIAVTLLGIWHMPYIFDYAQTHEVIHILQHLSFIAVGATGFLAARALGESFKLFALFSLNGIMAFIGLVFSVLNAPIYLVYSVNSHNVAGSYMIIMCILLLLIGLPSYLIHRSLFHLRTKTTTNKNNDNNKNKL